MLAMGKLIPLKKPRSCGEMAGARGGGGGLRFALSSPGGPGSGSHAEPGLREREVAEAPMASEPPLGH